jgi:transcriptional regulator with XRE-family HTH domain
MVLLAIATFGGLSVGIPLVFALLTVPGFAGSGPTVALVPVIALVYGLASLAGAIGILRRAPRAIPFVVASQGVVVVGLLAIYVQVPDWSLLVVAAISGGALACALAVARSGWATDNGHLLPSADVDQPDRGDARDNATYAPPGTPERRGHPSAETGRCVSLAQLAEVIDVHKSHIARIEAGQVKPSLDVLTAIGVALGADLCVRFFAGAGPRIHDRFQAPMVVTVLVSLDPRWQVDLEVPITRPSRGVIDLVLTDRSSSTTVAAEVYSELRRLEQQIRWSTEKADGLSTSLEEANAPEASRDVSRLLILRSTIATRAIARRYQATLATAYPARTRDVILALTTPSAPWPGPGIAWMHIHGTESTLMAVPAPERIARTMRCGRRLAVDDSCSAGASGRSD